MTNFNFYKANKAYGELYLKFPKVFLYSDKYKDLSNDAKIAYMVFKDRLQYSIHNNWIDGENNIYFVYTNKELGQLLNCSEHKVIKTKKELEDINLLLQVKQGFNAKKKRNEPNRLYLADLEVEAHEVYAFQNIEKPQQTPPVQGTAKNAVRQEPQQTPPVQGTAKNAVNQYKELSTKDTKDNKDTKYANQNNLLTQGLEKSNPEENRNLIDNLISEYNLENTYGVGIIRKFIAYSNNDYKTFKVFVDKLYFSHKKAQSETETPIYFDIDFTKQGDDFKKWLTDTFMRCVRKEKAGEIKTDFNNYLYGSFLNTFKNIGEQIKNEQDTKTQVPMFNLTKNED